MMLSWQFGLLMQIPEIVEWRSIRLGKKESIQNRNLAFWLNVLQPLAAYIGVTATVGSHDVYSIIGLIVYAFFVRGSVPRDGTRLDSVARGVVGTSVCYEWGCVIRTLRVSCVVVGTLAIALWSVLDRYRIVPRIYASE